MTTAFEEGVRAYLDALPALLSNDEGRYALIGRGEPVKVFDSRTDALTEGYSRFGQGFLVQKISRNDLEKATHWQNACDIECRESYIRGLNQYIATLESESDTAKAENARLTTEVIDTVEMLATAIARADAAEAGLVECRKDAERLDWLIGELEWEREEINTEGSVDFHSMFRGDDAPITRAVIDAETALAQPTEPPAEEPK